MKFVLLDVDATDPIPFPLQSLHQMTADKTACSTHQCFFQSHSPVYAFSISGFISTFLEGFSSDHHSILIAKRYINERKNNG
jgi:hypothetical protein